MRNKLAIFAAALSLLAISSMAYAVALPTGTALFETSLQSRISSTDTSMTLVANSLRGGQSISGYNCFTIDEGRSDSEYVCGTVSGTSVTGLERGLSLANGTSTIAALEFAHRAGADVKITDFPLIQRVRNVVNGGETLPNKLTYTSQPSSFNPLDLVDYQLVTQTAFGSTPVSVTAGGTGVSTLASGMVLVGNGTGVVLASSTPTVAALTASSTNATSTFAGQIAVTGTSTLSHIVATASSTFSGAGTTTVSSNFSSTATTSISCAVGSNLTLNGVSYVCPSTQGAAGSFLTNSGNGALSWGTTGNLVATSSASSSPATTTGTLTLATYTVPANSLGTGNVLRLEIPVSTYNDGSGGANTVIFTYGGSTVASCSVGVAAGSEALSGLMTFVLMGTGAANAQTGWANVSLSPQTFGSTFKGGDIECSGNVAIDSTAQRTITVTEKWNAVTGANEVFNIDPGILSLIK